MLTNAFQILSLIGFARPSICEIGARFRSISSQRLLDDKGIAESVDKTSALLAFGEPCAVMQLRPMPSRYSYAAECTLSQLRFVPARKWLGGDDLRCWHSRLVSVVQIPHSIRVPLAERLNYKMRLIPKLHKVEALPSKPPSPTHSLQPSVCPIHFTACGRSAGNPLPLGAPAHFNDDIELLCWQLALGRKRWATLSCK
jgi:hypothetical protein